MREGFFEPGQEELTDPYVRRYFAEIAATAEFRTGWSLGAVAGRAYPSLAATPATLELANQALAGPLAGRCGGPCSTAPTRCGGPSPRSTTFERESSRSSSRPSTARCRSFCSISSNSAWPQISGGATWTTGVAAVVSAAVEAGLEQRAGDVAPQHPFAIGGVEGLLGRLVLDQLDGVEVAVPADIADDRQVVEPFQRLAERVLVAEHVSEQVLPLEDVEVGEGDRAGHRVATERVAMREHGLAFAERLEDPVGDERRAERRVARREPLGAGDQVRLVAVLLGAEQRAQPAVRACELGPRRHGRWQVRRNADRDRLAIWFGDVRVAVEGERDPSYSEAAATAVMKEQDIAVRVEIGLGSGKATVYTCDLTKEYVEINGDYRS